MGWFERVSLVVAVAVLGLVGQQVLFTRQETQPNYCAMTFMWPNYLPLKVPSQLSNKYALYLYKNGQKPAVSSQEDILSLATGVPVLFIHGNAGSYRQVRSFGAVASRASQTLQFEGLRTTQPSELSSQSKQLKINSFDFFAVDLDEELSAFSGDVLRDQTAFLHDSIKFILASYKQRKVSNPVRPIPVTEQVPELTGKILGQPREVLLVGHSMGGIIARALFTLEDFDISTVSTIISLSSPHKRPVIEADYRLWSFYSEVNSFWQNEANRVLLKNVALVSICGGYRDLQVQTELCNASSFVSPSLTTISTNVPNVWLSTDHLACVWCNQFVVSVTTALTSLLDPTTKQVSKDVAFRMQQLNSVFESSLPKLLAPEAVTYPTKEGVDRAKLLEEYPVSKEELVVASNETKKVKFHWDLHNWPQHSHLQVFATTTNSLVIVGCNSKGCEDLKAHPTPLPFKIHYDSQAMMKDFARIIQPGFALNVALAGYETVFVKLTVEYKPGDMETLCVIQLTKDQGEEAIRGLTVLQPGHSLISRFQLSYDYIRHPISFEVGSGPTWDTWNPIIIQLTHGVDEHRYGFGSMVFKTTSPHATGYSFLIIANPQAPIEVTVSPVLADSIESYFLTGTTLSDTVQMVAFYVLLLQSSTESALIHLGLLAVFALTLGFGFSTPLLVAFTVGLTNLILLFVKPIIWLVGLLSKISLPVPTRPLSPISDLVFSPRPIIAYLSIASLAFHSTVTLTIAVLVFLAHGTKWSILAAVHLLILVGLSMGGFVIWVKELTLQWPLLDSFKFTAVLVVFTLVLHTWSPKKRMRTSLLWAALMLLTGFNFTSFTFQVWLITASLVLTVTSKVFAFKVKKPKKE